MDTPSLVMAGFAPRSVDTSGTESGVAMETEALRGSPLAGCIEDQVRTWKFPVHRVAMNAPVRFPFVF